MPAASVFNQSVRLLVTSSMSTSVCFVKRIFSLDTVSVESFNFFAFVKFHPVKPRFVVSSICCFVVTFSQLLSLPCFFAPVTSSLMHSPFLPIIHHLVWFDCKIWLKVQVSVLFCKWREMLCRFLSV